ncbi:MULTISPECIES: protein-disulfide reductase DsbD domain-containing protein [unclassified Rhizobium]|jgi:DsbC/DsbD-like thiol-disulfide interchange protein|uniref:protein-disulfide reductase DsbD domain-containing protein n=1 Tax=unclassified Rhizobium TaxID=2613769 RepID=UPI000375A61B|nr:MULTISPECIES: protein-disulfide reductase DsbD domain-containing protein [unclassified Rhizobium]MBD9448938.1 cytochrome C biogenesis protein [Rhizobium sp. RHZ01]NMN72099.1 DsbC/DsbD-like thiol-disulfide interchange protein [Rhizobium sp. 57MFTsu3.2]
MQTISLTIRQCGSALCLFVAVLQFSQPARAEMSAWADNEGGRMRLIALPPDANGNIRAGLQIEPKPGWITYWREPGNSGIPPQVTLSSEGVSLDKMSYPVPKHIVADKIDEVAYDAPVTFPLQLTAKDPALHELKANAFIGICEEICIPFQAELSLTFKPLAQSRPAEEAILRDAEAALPQAASSAFKVDDHALSADMKQLSLSITLPESGESAPEVIVTGPSGRVFTKQTATHRDGRNFTTTLSVDKLPKAYDLSGKTWSALVIDGSRAIETPLAFE